MEYLHNVLKFAVNMGASDVHIKPNHHVTIRVSGELVPVKVDTPTSEQVGEIVRHILPPHLAARFEREREADFCYLADEVGRFRANIFYQRGELAIALRHVKSKVPTLEELHLPPQLKKIAEADRGIVFVTGATGSGKSSTLAAMIDYVNTTQKCHVITLEDPIEYVFTDKECRIEQREVGLDTLSFERGLVHVLRQDPDIIMIGEMRDAPSFMAALTAADTGHLVLTTLHTNTAYSAIGRILDFFPATERDQIRRQIAATLVAVVCQRLVPAIPDGVVPAVEIMVNSPTVRKLIEENRLEKLSAAIETGTEDGMQTFNQALFKLWKDKRITDENAIARATNPDALRMNMKGIFLDESRRILSGA
jgi:twitching motility protein PilT